MISSAGPRRRSVARRPPVRLDVGCEGINQCPPDRLRPEGGYCVTQPQ